jgi:hypothetical protein
LRPSSESGLSFSLPKYSLRDKTQGSSPNAFSSQFKAFTCDCYVCIVNHGFFCSAVASSTTAATAGSRMRLEYLELSASSGAGWWFNHGLRSRSWGCLFRCYVRSLAQRGEEPGILRLQTKSAGAWSPLHTPGAEVDYCPFRAAEIFLSCQGTIV